MFTQHVTDELELKPLQDHHAKELFALVDANRDHLYKYMVWIDDTKTVDDTKNFITSTKKNWFETSAVCCGLWVDGRIIGVADLHKIDWTNRRTSIGYWLSKEHIGKGYMTEAVSAILDYAFDELDLNHVAIKAATDNKASRAIPERLGFTHEGTLRDDLKNRDQYFNHEVYGMRKSEWQARKKAS